MQPGYWKTRPRVSKRGEHHQVPLVPHAAESCATDRVIRGGPSWEPAHLNYNWTTEACLKYTSTIHPKSYGLLRFFSCFFFFLLLLGWPRIAARLCWGFRISIFFLITPGGQQGCHLLWDLSLQRHIPSDSPLKNGIAIRKACLRWLQLRTSGEEFWEPYQKCLLRTN